MNRTLSIALAAGLCAAILNPALGQAAGQAEPAMQVRLLNGDPTKPYDPASLLVKFREGTAAEVQDNAAALVGGTVAHRYRLVPGLVSISLAGIDSADAADLLARMPFVVYAEPDAVVTLDDTTPNDPGFGLLWGLHNTGQTVNGDPGANDADIDAPSGWDTWKYAADVVVAVIDSGVQYSSHDDLSANKWSNAGETLNGVDDDGNGFIDDVNGWDFVSNDNVPGDLFWHGTHVAGIIGARGNNSKGVCGVAWRVKLMPVRVANSSGSVTISRATQGIEYAVAMGARVSNCSWGTYTASSSLYDHVVAARDAGHLIVASAGNDGTNNDTRPRYPGSYDIGNVLCVAATDNEDDLAWFGDCGGTSSNYGATTVDLGAPGKNILSTIPDNAYAYACGTSMAAPHVTGAAALLFSQNPSWDYTRVRERLRDKVRPISALSGITVSGGILDLDRALVVETPEAPTGAAAAQRYDSGVLWARVTWNDASEWEDGFKIERSTYSSVLNAWSTFTQVGTVGEGVERFDDVRPEGRYWYRVLAFNAAGDSGAASATITLELDPPAAPSDCVVTDGGSMFPDIARVTWTDNSDDEDGFVVWRGRYFSGVGRWLYTSAGTVSANSTVFAESPGSGEWRYKVRAYNAAGNSSFSNVDSITLP